MSYAKEISAVKAAMERWLNEGESEGEIVPSDSSVKMRVDPFFWGEDEDGGAIFKGDLTVVFDFSNNVARIIVYSADCQIHDRSSVHDASIIVNEINQCCLRGHFEVFTPVKPSKSNPIAIRYRHSVEIGDMKSSKEILRCIDQLKDSAEAEFGYSERIKVWGQLGRRPAGKIVDVFLNDPDSLPAMALATGKTLL